MFYYIPPCSGYTAWYEWTCLRKWRSIRLERFIVPRRKNSGVRHFLDTHVSQTSEITSRPRKYFYSNKRTHWVYYISRHCEIRPKHERNFFQQVGHRVHRLPAIKREELLLNYAHETTCEIKIIRDFCS